ncbi:MAG: aminoacyl-tRNA hydrolase [Verrucomicrobiota bacterium]
MNRVRIIAGLGNPGEEYENTRHNAGFLALDSFAASFDGRWVWEKRFQADTCLAELSGYPVLLVKPRTFVNRSGDSLGALARYYKFGSDQFCVLYDDITLDPGRIKVSPSGSAGGHNGVADLLQKLGPDFVRFKIGVGGKSHPEMDLKDWVLGRISKDETPFLEESYQKVRAGLELLVAGGVERAMNECNTRSKAS